MKHRIGNEIRLASPMARLLYRVFGRKNPCGWADYHIVPEKHGTFWIHSHGLAGRIGADLEFVKVPPVYRDHALSLLQALAVMGAGRQNLQDGADFAANLSSSRQLFMAVGSLRATAHSDKGHEGLVRVVDFGRTLNSGFPNRLFAAHFTARADRADNPGSKITLYRTALKIFPGDFAEPTEGADHEPGRSSMTGLQNKSNLAAYLGLAQALRDQGRFNEACAYLAEAIARCPGWARAYRAHVVDTYDNNDAWFRFWRDADIAGIVARQRHAAAGGGRAVKVTVSDSKTAVAPGFGSRPPDPYEDLLNQG